MQERQRVSRQLCVFVCTYTPLRSPDALLAFEGTVLDAYADKGYPLYQLQLTHDVQRSVLRLGHIRASSNILSTLRA